MSFVFNYTRLIGLLILLVGQGHFIQDLYAQPTDAPLPAAGAPFGQQVMIYMESHSYTPSEVVVESGKPVTLTLSNQSFLVPHNFLLDDPMGNRVVDVEISSGDSRAVTLTLNEPGIYPFYCDKKLLFFPNHRKQGMEGRLIVR